MELFTALTIPKKDNSIFAGIKNNNKKESLTVSLFCCFYFIVQLYVIRQTKVRNWIVG